MSLAKTVALHTLGCKLNYSETSAITRLLEQDGFEKREFTEVADVYVINTCSVTDNADKECRQLVRRIQRKSPGSIIVITGCYAQLKPEEIASIEGVDLVLGADEIFKITQHINALTKENSAKICSYDIVEFVGNSKKFMAHFHIPLQSGSNKILGLMRIRYRKELYADKVHLIKKLMTHCAIGVDVIVGFPGESDEDFKETYDFINHLDISYLHVFTYSERDNTAALQIKPVVPMSVRNERNKMLRNLSYRKQNAFIQQHLSETRKVLFEQRNKNSLMEGYTDNYIKVTASYKEEWVNQIVDWKI